MDDEPEVIRQQMEATRSDLVSKIEALENKVTETVETATSQVTDTVESVKSAVQDTVDTVKETVGDTVDSVKNALDVNAYFEQYPWASFGASVAAGFVGGLLLGGGGRARGDRITELHSRGQAFTGPTRTSGYGGGGVSGREYAAAREASFTASPAHAEPGWAQEVGNRFGDELDKLKGVALGALFGLARDWIARAAPPQIGTRLSSVFDDVTRKLGGEPMRGDLLSGFGGGTATGKTSRERDAMNESHAARAASGL